MTANGHIIFTLASLLFCKKIKLSYSLAKGDISHIFIGGIITCLLPDIDHPRSILGYRLTFFSYPLKKIFGHRGFTHSLLAIISYLWIINNNKLLKFLFPIDFIHAMIVGYISHIIADMFTPIGVQLMWPYSYKFLLPFNISQNNKKKNIFLKILLIFNIINTYLYKLFFIFGIKNKIFYIYLCNICLYIKKLKLIKFYLFFIKKLLLKFIYFSLKFFINEKNKN